MKEDTKFSIDQLKSEVGFKEISRTEDKIFGSFSWRNPTKFEMYKTGSEILASSL